LAEFAEENKIWAPVHSAQKIGEPAGSCPSLMQRKKFALSAWPLAIKAAELAPGPLFPAVCVPQKTAPFLWHGSCSIALGSAEFVRRTMTSWFQRAGE
jgi:hypothetical protein